MPPTLALMHSLLLFNWLAPRSLRAPRPHSDDGLLEASEFCAALDYMHASMKLPFTDADMKNMLAEVEWAPGGLIDYKEFLAEASNSYGSKLFKPVFFGPKSQWSSNMNRPAWAMNRGLLQQLEEQEARGVLPAASGGAVGVVGTGFGGHGPPQSAGGAGDAAAVQVLQL